MKLAAFHRLELAAHRYNCILAIKPWPIITGDDEFCFIGCQGFRDLRTERKWDYFDIYFSRVNARQETPRKEIGFLPF